MFKQSPLGHTVSTEGFNQDSWACRNGACIQFCTVTASAAAYMPLCHNKHSVDRPIHPTYRPLVHITMTMHTGVKPPEAHALPSSHSHFYDDLHQLDHPHTPKRNKCTFRCRARRLRTLQTKGWLMMSEKLYSDTLLPDWGLQNNTRCLCCRC